MLDGGAIVRAAFNQLAYEGAVADDRGAVVRADAAAVYDPDPRADHGHSDVDAAADSNMVIGVGFLHGPSVHRAASLPSAEH